MISTFKIISGQELQTEINIIDYMGDLCGNSLYVDKVIYVDGDLTIEGDFTLKQSNELDSRADFMFIKGNLIINGDMNPLEETFPNIIVDIDKLVVAIKQQTDFSKLKNETWKILRTM